jgi:hypothetical protein
MIAKQRAESVYLLSVVVVVFVYAFDGRGVDSWLPNVVTRRCKDCGDELFK